MDPIIDRIINYQSKELNEIYRRQDYDYPFSKRNISNMKIINGLEKLGEINPKYVYNILKLCDLVDTDPTTFYIYKKLFGKKDYRYEPDPIIKKTLKCLLKNTPYEKDIDIDSYDEITIDLNCNDFGDNFTNDLFEKFMKKYYKSELYYNIITKLKLDDSTDQLNDLIRYYLKNYDYKNFSILELVSIIINDPEFIEIKNENISKKNKETIIKEFNKIIEKEYELEGNFVEYLDHIILDTLKNKKIIEKDT